MKAAVQSSGNSVLASLAGRVAKKNGVFAGAKLFGGGVGGGKRADVNAGSRVTAHLEEQYESARHLMQDKARRGAVGFAV